MREPSDQDRRLSDEGEGRINEFTGGPWREPEAAAEPNWARQHIVAMSEWDSLGPSPLLGRGNGDLVGRGHGYCPNWGQSMREGRERRRRARVDSQSLEIEEEVAGHRSAPSGL